MRARVVRATSVRPLITFETVATETPAEAATVASVVWAGADVTGRLPPAQ